MLRSSSSLFFFSLVVSSLIRGARQRQPDDPSNSTMRCFEESRQEHALAGNARRKRSLTFPKGSAFVLTMSMVKAIQLKEPANWNLDLEFDMIWPIPKGLDAVRRPNGAVWSPHRRHRRDLYYNLASAFKSQGIPGKQCVLRAICEAKFLLNPPGISLVEDLIRVVFSYPSTNDESVKYDDYDFANDVDDPIDCADRYYRCPFSILQLLLLDRDDDFNGD